MVGGALGGSVVGAGVVVVLGIGVVVVVGAPVGLCVVGRTVVLRTLVVVVGTNTARQLGVQQSLQAAHTSQFSGSSSGDPAGTEAGQALQDVLPAGQA